MHNEGNGYGDDKEEDFDLMGCIAVVVNDGMCEGRGRLLTCPSWDQPCP